MSRSKDKASVVNHGDHEVIVPENKLRAAVTNIAPDDSGEDPIVRAEKALAALSPEFGAWMHSECDRLDGARRDILRGRFTDANKEALFRAAHDIKGAVRAICREYGHSDAQKLATALTKQLREVTDDFLIKENRDRPDVLKQLKGPSIVPR